MIYLLFVLLLLILAVVFYWILKINTDRKRFKNTLSILNENIFQLDLQQKKQNKQLILSDEIKKKITSVNQSLLENIYELTFDIFDENYPKRTT